MSHQVWNSSHDKEVSAELDTVLQQFVHYFCGMIFGKYLHNEMSQPHGGFTTGHRINKPPVLNLQLQSIPKETNI